MMIIVVLLIVIISGSLFICSKRRGDDDASYWKDLFSVVTLRVVDYYYKSSSTKVVMIALRILGLMFEATSIGYPIINAGISCDDTNGFWKLFLTFHWDSFNSKMCICYIVAIVLIVVIYLFTNGINSKFEGIFHDLNKRLDNVETTIGQICTNVQNNGEKIDSLSTQLEAISDNLRNTGSATIKHLLPELENSISSLKIKSSFSLLKTILNEIIICFENDFVLHARVYYMLGECAKYIKDEDSKEYHVKAYQLTKNHVTNMPYVIEGMVYETCKEKKYVEAQKYADELKLINPESCWCFIPQLMNADDLRDETRIIPDSLDKKYVWACVLMLGGSKTNDIGVDIYTYEYNCLNIITTENFPLWIMDLSIATTRFCQNLVFYKNAKQMCNRYAIDLFDLSDKYLTLLGKTDIDNILPDTIFLHALTGYLKDRNPQWIEILETSKPISKNGMSEIYYLGYAYILDDCQKYEKAKKLLSEYEDPEKASIINARFILAFKNNDVQECVEIFKFAANEQICFPDHLSGYLFITVYSLYDSVKDFVDKIQFKNPLTNHVFVEFVKSLQNKDVDTDFLVKHKRDYSPHLLPFVAIIVKKRISLELAIDLLEHCVDREILDIRSMLLIDYYKEAPSCRQKLYHLLGELRLAGNIDINNLALELHLSMNIMDYDNGLQITTEMMKLEPHNDSVLINHIQVLYLQGGHELEIRGYKDRLLKGIIPAKFAIALFNIYHNINETAFAVEFLYQQIISTRDQRLKDFWFNMHMNPEVDKLITIEKEKIEIGDFVSIKINNDTKDVIVDRNSVFEDLCGHRKYDKIVNINGNNNTEILSIHTKYFKLTKDICRELKDYGNSKTIKMFNMDDFGFEEDPLGALQKIVGDTKENRQREQARLLQYRTGETPLLCFVNDNELFYGLYEKIFGNFMICNVPNELYNNIIPSNFDFNKVEVVLDISSLIVLYEYDLKYELSYDKKFILPKSISLILKQEILNEEKGFPKFLYQRLSEKLTIKKTDNNKTALWNKFKDLEKWMSDHCDIVTVEESVNFMQEEFQGISSKIILDCFMLAQNNRILLTEDWFYTRKFLRTIPIMSAYNWLSMIKSEHSEDWGQWMLECGNVGYPMNAEYIRNQYDLCLLAKPNNYQTCLENMKYHLPSAEEVVKAAYSLFGGHTTPADIEGATNMLATLFKGMNEKLCSTLLLKVMISSKDKNWIQCVINAIKISHPILWAH